MIFLSPECKAACRDCIKGGAMEGDEHFLVKATAVLPSHFSVWVAPSLLEPRAQQSGVQGEWEQWALPHRKDWWWVLWGRSQEILSVDISAFELLIILQLGKRKLVLLLHMFFVSGVYDMLNMLSCMLWELWQRIQPEDVVSSPILWSALLRSVIPQVRSTTNKPWGLLDLSYTEFFSFFYATVSFFTPCSSAASEQAQGIAFLARHHGSDVIWDGISADTCTSDCPTAACQVRVHHMPGKSHLISVLEMLSQSQSFCYNFWLKTEFSWSERTFQVPEQAYLENVLISPCSTTACHRKELKILVLQHLAAQLPL